MGDSNLATLPDYNLPGLQVDCFPDAHFRHAHALLEKTTPIEGLLVKKIIMSFGISSRANKYRETTLKSVQAVLRTARKRFPGAEVWIQQVNHSPALPPGEQENLAVLNQELEGHMPYVPLLPQSLFSVEEDNVSWTLETGVAYLQHWRDFLCVSP